LRFFLSFSGGVVYQGKQSKARGGHPSAFYFTVFPVFGCFPVWRLALVLVLAKISAPAAGCFANANLMRCDLLMSVSG
jgi:hypothetical protein